MFHDATRRGNPLWLPWVGQARGRGTTGRGRNGAVVGQGRYKTCPYDGGGSQRDAIYTFHEATLAVALGSTGAGSWHNRARAGRGQVGQGRYKTCPYDDGGGS